MKVLDNESKSVFQFRPSDHWNYVPESVYKVLTKFYDSDRLRVVDLIEKE